MNIGPYIGSDVCNECGSKGPGLREIAFRSETAHRLVLCPGCGHRLKHVLRVEFERPHLRTQAVAEHVVNTVEGLEHSSIGKAIKRRAGL